MKKFLIALAGAAALAAPISAPTGAFAQGRGGHGGGGFHGGGFHGGGFHGGWGGYRGGWGGYRGWGGYGGWGWGWGGLGFALGAAWADPWYWDAYYYPYYGYYGPVVYADPAYGYPPPPAGYAPPPAGQPPAQAAPNGQACGQWIWDQAQATYHWQPGACAPAS